jgi:hypothetical protein
MPYRVQISANMLSWPRLCACCGENPDAELRAAASRTTGVRVKHTTTSGWDVPYCSHCIKHTAAHAGASAWLYLGPIVALGLWWFLGQQFDDARTGVIAAGGSMLLSICLFCLVRVRATRLMLESCGSVTPAVRYLAWHGSFQTFVFSSKSYLDLFLAANSRKHCSDVKEVRIGDSESGGALFWCLVAGVLIWWWVSYGGEYQKKISSEAGSAVQTERAPRGTSPTAGHFSKTRPVTKYKSSAHDQKGAGSEMDSTAQFQKEAPQVPEAASAKGAIEGILTPVRNRDQQAAEHIASYCAAATAASTVRASAEAACRRDEVGAWQRLVEGNEFPTLDESTRQKCREPPFPDSYVAKEACAKYELHVN